MNEVSQKHTGTVWQGLTSTLLDHPLLKVVTIVWYPLKFMMNYTASCE